jgi:FkbM family methyltransferase
MFNESVYMENLPKTDGIALDIGANIGVYTKLLAEKFKKVYAFEPHWGNANVLRNNTQNFPNVEVVEKAVSDRNGTIKIYGCGHHTGWSINENLLKDSWARDWGYTETGSFEVETITLDSFCKNKKIDFIKCDIEGGENFIWRYAEETLTNNKNLQIVLETHLSVDLPRLYNLFRVYGFTIYDNPFDRPYQGMLQYGHQYLIKRAP